MNIISLLTDFGSRGSHYVAAMKAVILNISPETKIIDLSHMVKPFSIIEGSYILKSNYSYFPKQTIFVVVIDPGVGSERGILALKTNDGYYFVGPDNGILPAALGHNIEKCALVENDKYFHRPVSSTFHGRDIMSPVAAYISLKTPLKNIGPIINQKQLKMIEIPLEIKPDQRKIKCCIQYIDEFGNITTNIPLKKNKISNTDITLSEKTRIKVRKNNSIFEGNYSSHFASVSKDSLLFLQGSTGFLEISINQGNASKILDISSGDVIKLQLE
ncbi:MAG: SAM hydrolase/SAM-dependent halogenase family protein [Promethearchaeati archaeon]